MNAIAGTPARFHPVASVIGTEAEGADPSREGEGWHIDIAFGADGFVSQPLEDALSGVIG